MLVSITARLRDPALNSHFVWLALSTITLEVAATSMSMSAMRTELAQGLLMPEYHFQVMKSCSAFSLGRRCG